VVKNLEARTISTTDCTDNGELAPNERFVERMVKLAAEFGRGVATPDEARQIMHLKAR
jgi:uncharacterized protein (DUF849 family)